MKKLLLSAAFLAATFIGANAQISVSFEASEGYTLGNINEQNGWGVTQLPDNPNNPSFTITDSEASDGSNSFYVNGTNVQYQNNQGQTVLIGAFSDLMEISATTFDLSVDVYMTTPTTAGNGSDLHIGAQSTGEELLTSRVKFNYQGNVSVLESIDGAQAAFQDATTFEYDTWYTLKMSYDFNAGTIEYFLNGESIYQGATWTNATTVDQLFFVYDNYESGFYIDNIVISSRTVSVEDFASNFSVYPNPATNVINVANSADVINNVTITDLNGRTVKQVAVGVNDAQINISDLSQGVYILNATTNGKSFTQKIVKQ